MAQGNNAPFTGHASEQVQKGPLESATPATPAKMSFHEVMGSFTECPAILMSGKGTNFSQMADNTGAAAAGKGGLDEGDGKFTMPPLNWGSTAGAEAADSRLNHAIEGTKPEPLQQAEQSLPTSGKELKFDTAENTKTLDFANAPDLFKNAA